MSTSPTQQFDGNTIEEALGAAVASMGDDLEIIDAQRVRKRRRFGVRREERFEVIAAPRSSADEFDDVLRRMVARVDDRERAHEVDLRGPRADATVDLRAPRGGVDLADSDLSWWETAEFVVPELPPSTTDERADEIDVRTPPTALDDELFGPGLDAAPAAAAVGAAPGDVMVADPVAAVDTAAFRAAASAVDGHLPSPVAVAPASRARLEAEPESTASTPTFAPVASTPAPEVPRAGASGWSLEALADLGLAPMVIERVAARDPQGDLQWVAALAESIEEIATAMGQHSTNVELTGHGRHAAVDLIGGLCRGMRVGDLVIDGVRTEATPVELALGVRACLQG